jgi:hypothetical protein
MHNIGRGRLRKFVFNSKDLRLCPEAVFLHFSSWLGFLRLLHFFMIIETSMFQLLVNTGMGGGDSGVRVRVYREYLCEWGNQVE